MTAVDALRAAGFTDPVHYIEAITYAIWNWPERDPELIRRWYSPDCVIHTDWGDLRSADAVIANTHARLIGYPDFDGRIDDTIWIEREDGTIETSMRWRWTGTDTGGTAFGPATGRLVEHVAIADCVVDETLIIREWLGSDMLGLARQLGLSPAGARNRLGDTRSSEDPERYRNSSGRTPAGFMPAGQAGALVSGLLEQLFAGADLDRLIPADCLTTVAGDESDTGSQIVRSWLDALSAAGPLELILHDQYANSAATEGSHGSDPIVRVATRGELRLGGGLGSINLIAHHHLRQETIIAQWLLADRLAALSLP